MPPSDTDKHHSINTIGPLHKEQTKDAALRSNQLRPPET